jgi:lipoyl(octanoyl) transferase
LSDTPSPFQGEGRDGGSLPPLVPRSYNSKTTRETVTKRLSGPAPYEPTWRAMQEFTLLRDAHTADEIWLLQHPPVYTLGLAGRPDHLREETTIPVIKTDRGGQITYHGPGQLVAYLLLDLVRLDLGVRELVCKMEQAIIDLLADFDIRARRRTGAPGVYVDDAKIAALGLRVRHGRCYHGLALNVDMDLTPFEAIDPCGYPGLKVTQLRDCGVRQPFAEVGQVLLEKLLMQVTSWHR